MFTELLPGDTIKSVTVFCYTVGSAVHAWEFVYDLSAVGNSYLRHEPFVPN
jgi:hypothetical protein